MIKTLKKGSRIMITGYNQKGSQTIDHYSLLGFTKAYKASKANCRRSAAVCAGPGEGTWDGGNHACIESEA